jgi:hypothetical protein
MPRTPEQLEQIKVLFKKLYDAHRWVESHPAIEYPDKHRDVIVPAVEGWCDELELLGINRTFSMCIYSFGTDWQICYQMVNGEVQGLTIPDSL